jgi:hypothetical protein
MLRPIYHPPVGALTNTTALRVCGSLTSFTAFTRRVHASRGHT